MPDRPPPDDLPPDELHELLTPEQLAVVSAGLTTDELSDLRQMLTPATPAFRSSFVGHFARAEGFQPAARRMFVASARAAADAAARAGHAASVGEGEL